MQDAEHPLQHVAREAGLDDHSDAAQAAAAEVLGDLTLERAEVVRYEHIGRPCLLGRQLRRAVLVRDALADPLRHYFGTGS